MICCPRRGRAKVESSSGHSHLADPGSPAVSPPGGHLAKPSFTKPRSAASRLPRKCSEEAPSPSRSFLRDTAEAEVLDTVTDQVEKAEDIVQRLRNGEDIDDVFRDLGLNGTCRGPCGTGKTLMVVYTDLEPDDLMFIAQHWQWKIEVEGMEGAPLIIQHANFDLKDHGTIFELKQVAARLMLGALDIHVLSSEGDQGGTRLHDDAAHSESVALSQSRSGAITAICEQISTFGGERIEWYILSSGSGNLAAIVEGLEALDFFPPQAALKVSMYTGSYTMRGMHRADIQALEKLTNCAATPFLDINKPLFFGADRHHSMAAILATFAATEAFTNNLSRSSPLLGATLKLINDEFNKDSIHPSNHALFEGELSKKERLRFNSIKIIFGQGESRELAEYATAIMEDSCIFARISNQKKATIRAFAYGGCVLPVCSQLLFLHSWMNKEHPDWLIHTTGRWSCDLAAGTTAVRLDGRAESMGAVTPRLRDEANVEQMGEVLETYFWRHLNEVCEQNEISARGNLHYTVSENELARAKEIVCRLHHGADLKDIFRDLGMVAMDDLRAGEGSTLMVAYTDLEAEDVMTIAQLWQRKTDAEGMQGQPLIVQHACFDSKDSGGLHFEMKQLAARLMLGDVTMHVLMHEGDQGGTRLQDDVVHPQAVKLARAREQTIAGICEQLATFRGERIEWYIMSPGSGNLAAIIEGLEARGTWPLPAELHVTICSGAVTIRGMHRADIKALEKMMSHAASPLVDLNKEVFFGADCHPWTTSLANFAPQDFADIISEVSPLLCATLKLLNDEFVKSLIHPENKYFFAKVLHGEEARRFEHLIKPLFKRGDTYDVQLYAKGLLNDEALFNKVAASKKSAIRAFAHGGCDSPFYNELLFLYEWLRAERPESLRVAEGSWICVPAAGSSSVKQCIQGIQGLSMSMSLVPGTTSIDAVQPSLRNGRDESVLMDMRNSLLDTLHRRLCASDVLLRYDLPFDASSTGPRGLQIPWDDRPWQREA